MSTFEEIYAQNYTRMFRVAQKMVGDVDNASDIVQEVFIYLLNKLNSGYVIFHTDTWLYRATINKSIDSLKKQNRLRTMESLKESETDEKLFDNKEITYAMNRAVAKLKHKEKIIVVLYSEGLSYKEIAIASGIRFSSIGKTLSRSLEKLEKELISQKYELY